MNSKKNENVDELANRIAELAVELKKEIKNLTTGEWSRIFKYNIVMVYMGTRQKVD